MRDRLPPTWLMRQDRFSTTPSGAVVIMQQRVKARFEKRLEGAYLSIRGGS